MQCLVLLLFRHLPSFGVGLSLLQSSEFLLLLSLLLLLLFLVIALKPVEDLDANCPDDDDDDKSTGATDEDTTSVVIVFVKILFITFDDELCDTAGNVTVASLLISSTLLHLSLVLCYT